MQEAKSSRLDHAEFLELILQDEMVVRRDRQIARLRVKNASTIAPHHGVPLDTLESFLSGSAASHTRIRARTLKTYGQRLNDELDA